MTLPALTIPTRAAGERARRTPTACWLAWVGLLSAFVWIAWRDVPTLMSRILSDDMFYYLALARRFAQEGLVSFDGVTRSNGFQPLWMLVLAGVMQAMPDDPALAVHLALTLIAVCFVAQGVLLQRIFAAYGHPQLGALVSLWWLLNPVVIGIMALGLETALYGATILAVLLLYLPRRDRLTVPQAALVGGALGSMLLARLDGALFAAALGVDATWLAARRRAWAVPSALIASGAALLIPWVVWSLAVVGTPLPTSGRALDLWAFPIPDLIQRGLWGAAIPALGGNLLEWTTEQLRWLSGYSELPRLPTLALAAALAIRAGFSAWVALVVFTQARYAAFRAALLGAATHSAYYLLRLPNARYLLPSLLVELVVVSLVAGDAVARLRGRWACQVRRAAVAGVALSILGFVILVGRQWQQGTLSTPASPLHVTMYGEGVAWLRQHTAPETIVGSFNAGIFGYWSGRRVVNLDGVINEEAYRALAAHRLADYVDEAGIEWVIDWNGQLEWFLARFNQKSGAALRFEPVAAFEQSWRSARTQLMVYRVVR